MTSHSLLGYEVTGYNLSQPLSPTEVDEIRQLWLQHRVIYFVDQPLEHLELERFSTYFGAFGDDPYVVPVPEHPHILEVRRNPDEPVAPFGSSWHSDWSFQAAPPSATILHSKVVPPIGGDTHFCDCIAAYRTLPESTKRKIAGLQAIHSARRPYSPEGFKRGQGERRSMKIEPSEQAWSTQYHPLVRTHPETGESALWINPVYTIGIRGMTDHEAQELLAELFQHMLWATPIYQHQWSANMLTMWDNRSVLHCAQGGYDGHLRVMHRVTLAGSAPY